MLAGDLAFQGDAAHADVLKNDTSRTARNDPNCLHSPSASIINVVNVVAAETSPVHE